MRASACLPPIDNISPYGKTIPVSQSNGSGNAALTLAHNTSKYGENLASATGPRLTPASVVNMWGGEVNDCTYSSNRCATGKMCGHYTQVVWRTTIQVGCGMARIGSSEVWVCNFNPPGNYVGQRPY